MSMRRALVISLLAHFAVLATLYTHGLLPWIPLSPERTPGLIIVVLSAPKNLHPHDDLNLPIEPQIPGVVIGKRMLSDRGKSELKTLAAGTTKLMRLTDQVKAIPPAAVPEHYVRMAADVEVEYRLALAAEMRKSKIALAEAENALPSGAVSLLITLWSGLARPAVTVQQSSGHPVLDAHAVNRLSDALGRVPVPQGIDGGAYRIPFKLEYRQGE